MEYFGPVPNTKLKSLILEEVEKVQALNTQSIWCALGNEIHSIRFDDELITKLFAKSVGGGVGGKSGSGDTSKLKILSRKKSVSGKKELNLIDAKRMHNLNISLSRMKLPVSVVTNSLMSVNTTVLTTEIVDVLKLVMPLPQELKAVSALIHVELIVVVD